MLREVRISQRDDGTRRRWFTDRKLDLIVWIAEDATVDSFQLCYVRLGSEYALTWTRANGYCHDRIDDGERIPAKNLAAILISSGLLRRFHESSGEIELEIRHVIEEKLSALASRLATSRGRGAEQRIPSEALPEATL